MPRAYIGCSGWRYASWRGPFYPDTLPASEWLGYYATQFNTVEINNTFYRLPETPTFAAWRAATPHRFTIAVKASGYLTHRKRLRAPAEPLARLFSRASALGPRLGPILYQLPSTPGSAIVEAPDQPFVYVRFHGTEGKYSGNYSDSVLDGWGQRLRRALAGGHDVYAYFNNDLGGTAVQNARTLTRYVCRPPGNNVK